ncbi:hypothetical protein ACS0TY_021852 [Phlomoides rotata]
MSLLSRFFYKRPPDGLLELSDRVYVFDSCFTTEVLPEDIYQLYLHEIINELNEEFPESSFLAFNFREGEKKSQFAKILCEYDVTVMDYPRQYEGCPLLPLSLVHHFLRVSESWLSLGNCQNVVLLHCERGGWPLLAFVLASFLVFRKLHSSERKTLEMVYREGPRVENKPDLLDFSKDLIHLEPASKIQLKTLAEEMQAVSKGLEKVEQELTAAENDGAVSSGFRKVLKSFHHTAEAEVRSLINLYSEVGRNADSLSQYFGEDPARCPFEQVTQTLAVFTKMFNKAHNENEQLAEAEKKKLEKEALKEQAAAAANSPAWKESPVRKEGIDALRAKINSRNQK